LFYNCPNLKSIASINISGLTGSITNSIIYGCDNLKSVVFKNIGTASGLTSLNFIDIHYWGYDYESTTTYKTDNNYQSLKDSLLTYSYDRATAGYNTCTISLHNNVKAILDDTDCFSAAEIAEITAKGYTIA